MLVQSNMTILDLIKAVKINFSHGIIERDSGSILDYQFPISPKDFLSFSKQDFKADDRRGNINALTNAKRAIDCQTDKIFSSLGVDPNDFPPIIEEFISKSNNSPAKKDLPLRLKFLQAMTFAPAQIIANARLLRNKLEHYYREPSDDEVANAIELAELFILATDNKLKDLWDFTITDEDKHSKSNGHLWDSVYVTYDTKRHCFNITAYIGKNDREEITIGNTHIEFYYLLKVATSFDYEQDVQDTITELLDAVGHPIPKQNICIESL